MRRGARLGVDVGRARVGVAACGADALLAMPVETVHRTDALEPVIARLVELAAEYEAMEIVVGLPLSLAGGDTPSTADAKAVASALADRVSVPVRLVDERLTTVSAARGMRQSGKKAKQQRSQIDQAAAVVILQHALDGERNTGLPPGEPV